MSAFTCPRCGGPIHAGQKFCAQCALPLDAASLAAYRPPAPATPVNVAPARSAPRSRGRGCLIAVAVCLAIGGIGAAYQAVTHTGNFAPATATPARPAVAARPTDAPAPPTAVLPTATAAPSFGSTVMLADWTISLAKMESRQTIEWSTVGNAYKASGTFWLLWVDGRNMENSTRSLANSIQWTLLDDHGTTYDELGKNNDFALSEFARLQGRDVLNAAITPRGLAHPLLVFDVAADATPVALIAKDDRVFGSDEVRFSLQKLE